MKLHEILRTGHVNRWHIVRTAREQTVAEHMYRVTMIADHLASKILPASRYLLNSEQLIRYALHHDVTEAITGDTATPTKRIGDFDDSRINTEWDNLRNEFGGTPIGNIVKLADFIEAAAFLVIEGIGKHADVVHEGIVDNCLKHVTKCEHNWPDYNWQAAREILAATATPATT